MILVYRHRACLVMDAILVQPPSAADCFRSVLASSLEGEGHQGVAPKAFDDLDWAHVQRELADRCVGDDARELAASIGILADGALPRRRMAEVAEAKALLDRGDAPPLRGIASIGRALLKARKQQVLTGHELVDISKSAFAQGRVAEYVGRGARIAPLLAEHAARVVDVQEVARELGRCFDPAGELTDDASPDLGKLRRRVKRIRSEIHAQLDQILKSPKFDGILQDEYVTIRDERFVVPVRAGERGDFPGIVHGSSGSGQTLFIEPRQLIEPNNAYRVAQIAVEDEVRRILRRLTQIVTRRADDLETNQDILTYLDLSFASGRMAADLRLLPVVLTEPDDTDALRVTGARHPILAFRELAGELKVVPNDIEIAGRGRVLVVSGPNTGGKTVTLKTVGLFALMARAGLPLPVEPDGRFPLFSNIFSDIGDEQTVERDLSTFSGHVRNLASFFDDVDHRSLVLLDELFAGTDPEQGAALGRALLERFANREAVVIVTTHLESLKTLGYEDERFIAASVAFDVDSLAPTYRLRVGVPGSSYALRIAQRLGLDATVVEAAETLLSGGVSLERESMIERLEREFHRAATERESLADARRELEANAAKLEDKRQKLIERDRKMVDRDAGKLKAELDRLRGELKTLSKWVRNFQSPTTPEEAIEAERAIEAGREVLRDGDRAVVEARQPSTSPRRDRPALSEDAFVAGTRVFVPAFKKNGEIVEIHRDRAVVQLGPMRANFALSDLQVGDEAPEVENRARTVAPTPTAEVERSVDTTLDLRGERAEDALERLDAYIDRALRAHLPVLFVVHGHGTGVLKRAVRDHLRSTPLVVRWRPGERGEGGDGVTVVEFTSAS